MLECELSNWIWGSISKASFPQKGKVKQIQQASVCLVYKMHLWERPALGKVWNKKNAKHWDPCTVGAWQLWASTLISSSKCHPGWAPRPAITVLIHQGHSATFQHNTSLRTKPWKDLKLTLKTVITILIICEAQCTRNFTLFKHLTYIIFL